MGVFAGRRRTRVLAVLVGLMALAVCVALIPSLARAQGCSDSWTGAANTPTWDTAQNWSNGTPVASSDVCIEATGTYTVAIGNETVHVASLTVGATGASPTLTIGNGGSGVVTATIDGTLTIAAGATVSFGFTGNLTAGTIDNAGTFKVPVFGGSSGITSGDFTNSGTFSAAGPTTLTLNTGATLDNEGTVATAASTSLAIAPASGNATFQQDTGGVIDNAGTMSVVGTLALDAGSICGTAVQLGNVSGGTGGTLSFAGGANVAPTCPQGTTTSDALKIVNVPVTLSGTIPAAYTVGAGDAGSGEPTVTLSGDVVNNGTLALGFGLTVTAPTSTDLLTNNGTVTTPGSGYTDILNFPLVNNGTVNLTDAVSTTLPTGSAWNNTSTGTINTTASKTFSFGSLSGDSATFTQDGTINNAGAMHLAGDVHINGGSICGTAVQFGSGDIGIGGTLSFASGANVAPTCPQGTNSDGVFIPNVTATIATDIPAPYSVTIGDTGSGFAHVSTPGNLVNAGTLEPVGGATLSVNGTLLNTGTIEIPSTEPTSPISLPSGAAFTNAGTIQVDAGGVLHVSDFVAKSGTIAPAGTFLSTGSFTEIGGRTSTGPVKVQSGQLSFQGNGQSSFLVPAGAAPSIAGDIAAGQTLTIDDVGGSCGGTVVNASAAFTNSGTIAFQSNVCPASPALLTVGGTLTNHGTISFSQTQGGAGELDAPVTNAPGATIVVDNGGDGVIGGALTNQGTVTAKWGTINLTGGLTNLDGSTSTLTGGTYQVLGSSGDPAALNISRQVAIQKLNAALELGVNASIGGSASLAITQIGASGTLTLDPGETLNPLAGAAALVNDGGLSIGAGDQLSVGTYAQGASASLSVGVAGSPGATGALGSITATGAVSLAGKLIIVDATGFTPSSGNTYNPVTGGSLTGTFTAVSGTNIGGGLTYTVQYTATGVQLLVGVGVELAVSGVTGPPSATVGQPITVGWTVSAPGAAVTGSWTDAVYLSPTTGVTPASVQLGTATHAGGLLAGGSYHGSLTATLPGVLPARWRLVVVTDARDQTGNIDSAGQTAASSPLTVSMTTVAVGASVNGTIPAAGDVYVEVNPATGSNLELNATFAGSTTGALFAAFGRVPSPSDHDTASADTAGASQSVTFSNTQPGAYFVDLNNPTGTPQSFTLAAAAPATTVDSVTPSSSAFVYECSHPIELVSSVRRSRSATAHDALTACPAIPLEDKLPAPTQANVTMTINGIGFTPASTASLACTGLSSPASGPSATITATSVTYVSPAQLYASFGTVPSPSGSCTLTVTTGNRSATLANAISFTADYLIAPSVPGASINNPVPLPLTPQVSVKAPSINRPNTDSTVLVTYKNPYPYEIPAPLMEVVAHGATIHYTDLPASANTALPLLGTAPTGDPGVLEPGQSGSVAVAFDSTSTPGVDVDFSLDTLQSPSNPLDIGKVLAGFLPAGTSAAVTNYVAGQDASATGAQLQSMLDDDATYLASIGHPAGDAAQLYAYELNKITNYGTVVADHVDGPLGVGLPGLVDSASVDNGGDVTVTDPTGATTTFEKLPAGGYAAPAGVQSRLTWNGIAWVMSQPDGSSAMFNAGGQLASSADRHGNTTQYTYTGAELTSVSTPAGDQIALSYDTSGHITQIADGATGLTSTYTYDSSGRLASISGGGTSEQLTWNHSAAQLGLDGTLASITDESGVTTAYTYDDAGQPTSVTRNGATLVQYAYPTSGTVEIADSQGSSSSVQLDASGQPARAVLGDGTSVSDTLNSHYLPTNVTIGGISVLLGYDNADNLTSITNPNGDQTSLSYSAPGRLAGVTAPDGLQTQLTTDAQDDVTALTDPAGNSTSLTYTPAGDVASLTDRNGKATARTYDSAGELTSETLPGGGVASFGYDARHNLVSASDSAGTTTYTFDADNRLTGATYPNGLGVSYTYDAAGRRASETASDGYQLNYHYGTDGHLASLTDHGGATIVSYSYTAAGYPATITNGNGTSTAYTYDSRGHIVSVTDKAPGGGTTASFSYTRNALGETTAITSGSGTNTYAYDAAGQLIRAVLAGGRTLTYSYDAAGNRTATTDSSGSPANYTQGPDDEYSSAGATSYTYDADGNIATATDAGGTTTYTWNAFGQLASANGPHGHTSYTYDALGNLIATDVNGATTNQLTDPQSGNLLGSYTGATPLEHYIHGLGVVGQADPSGATSYFGFDGTGNVISLSDHSGAILNTAQYLPFGEIAGHTGSTPTVFGFSGQFGVTTDPVSGLTQNGARFYDPATGRFVSQDPVPFSAPNPYEYGDNDPLDQADVTGKDPSPVDYLLSPAGSVLVYSANHVNLGIGDAVNQVRNPANATDRTNGGLTLAGDAATLVQGGATTVAATKDIAIASGNLNVVGTVLKYDKVVSGASKLANGLNVLGFGIGLGQTAYQASHGQNLGADGSIVTGANTLLSTFSPVPFTGLILTGAESVVDAGSQSFFYWLYGVNPDDVYDPAASDHSKTRSSHDPNDMVGPNGFGTPGYVQGGTPLPYQVDFANLAGASLPAQTVTVTEPLDPNVDLATFSLGAFGFGGHVITPPAGLRAYQTTIDDTALSGLDVKVQARLDTASRTVTWTFSSIDPATGLAPTDASKGFLPADQTPPNGEGFVSYDVTPNASAGTGTVISANATVQFDANAPMTTTTISNTLDDTTPATTIAPLPATETAPFTVSWSSDDTGGSGIAFYDVGVSDNGAAYTPLATNTTNTSTTFTGQPGHTYQFVASATSNVGVAEPLPGPQAYTTVNSPTTSTTPPPGKPAPPRISVASSSVSVSGRSVPVKLSCAAAPCAGTVTLSSEKLVTVRKGQRKTHKQVRVVLGTRTYTVAAGHTVVVVVSLSGVGETALRTARGGRLAVTATATVKGGKTATRTITLRQAPKKHHKPKRKR